MLATGAMMTQQRRFALGLADSETCRRCGNGPETPHQWSGLAQLCGHRGVPDQTGHIQMNAQVPGCEIYRELSLIFTP